MKLEARSRRSRKLVGRVATLGALGALSILFGCTSEEDRAVASECSSLRRSLQLSDDQERRCKDDATYRRQAVELRNTHLATSLVQSHNDALGIMAPRRLDGYVRVSRVADLPLNWFEGMAGDDNATKQIGRKFVIAGFLDADASEDGDISISLRTLQNLEPEDFTLISAHGLNDYQKTFLERHCWINMGTEPSSLCQGDIYLSIRAEPDEMSVATVLDGAILSVASQPAVLYRLSNP